jgi:hypothetical protein
MGGSNLGNQAGVYGMLGTPAAGNVPSARYEASAWTDPSGNFWLFGGEGTYNHLLNDLWQYSAGQWTWRSGSTTFNQAGTYGTRGTPAPSNVPGARQGAMSWADKSGDLWLFGGFGTDYMNDLWKYAGGNWTWVAGPQTAGQSGVYGTPGVAAASNVPGARAHAASWIDGSGNLWMMGGTGYDSTGFVGKLNDLWEFTSGQWVWKSGSNLANQSGVYGTVGSPASTTVPGARGAAVSWIGSSGELWLFGGNGYDSKGQLGWLGDLWRYASGQWVWMSGTDVAWQLGTFGTEAVPAPGNTPGGHYGGTGWVATDGSFWMFGGYSCSTAVCDVGDTGNDLWRYASGQWTWMSGTIVSAQTTSSLGVYGSPGSPAVTNVPGGRLGAVSWVDAKGQAWIFGGQGYDSVACVPGNPTCDLLNDLWRY